MIKCKLLLCAEGVVRDSETGNISVFNIIQDIHLESLPALIPRFTIFFVVEREEDDPVNVEVLVDIKLVGQSLGRAVRLSRM